MPKEKQKDFSPGDLVFAKVKGYPPWPARINTVDPEEAAKIPKGRYPIFFFGTYETYNVGVKDLYPYKEFKDKFGKVGKRTAFNLGLEEIEKKPHIVPSDDLRFGKKSETKETPLATSKGGKSTRKVKQNVTTKPSKSETEDSDDDDDEPLSLVQKARSSAPPQTAAKKRASRVKTAAKQEEVSSPSDDSIDGQRSSADAASGDGDIPAEGLQDSNINDSRDGSESRATPNSPSSQSDNSHTPDEPQPKRRKLSRDSKDELAEASVKLERLPLPPSPDKQVAAFGSTSATGSLLAAKKERATAGGLPSRGRRGRPPRQAMPTLRRVSASPKHRPVAVSSESEPELSGNTSSSATSVPAEVPVEPAAAATQKRVRKPRVLGKGESTAASSPASDSAEPAPSIRAGRKRRPLPVSTAKHQEPPGSADSRCESSLEPLSTALEQPGDSAPPPGSTMDSKPSISDACLGTRSFGHVLEDPATATHVTARDRVANVETVAGDSITTTVADVQHVDSALPAEGSKLQTRSPVDAISRVAASQTAAAKASLNGTCGLSEAPKKVDRKKVKAQSHAESKATAAEQTGDEPTALPSATVDARASLAEAEAAASRPSDGCVEAQSKAEHSSGTDSKETSVGHAKTLESADRKDKRKASVSEEQIQRLKQEKMRVQLEKQLVTIDNTIKYSLTVANKDIPKCLAAMDELNSLKLTPSVISKHPDIVDTLKKCRKYKGDSLVQQKAESLCLKLKDVISSDKDVMELLKRRAVKENEAKRKEVSAAKQRFDATAVTPLSTVPITVHTATAPSASDVKVDTVASGVTSYHNAADTSPVAGAPSRLISAREVAAPVSMVVPTVDKATKVAVSPLDSTDTSSTSPALPTNNADFQPYIEAVDTLVKGIQSLAEHNTAFSLNNEKSHLLIAGRASTMLTGDTRPSNRQDDELNVGSGSNMGQKLDLESRILQMMKDVVPLETEPSLSDVRKSRHHGSGSSAIGSSRDDRDDHHKRDDYKRRKASSRSSTSSFSAERDQPRHGSKPKKAADPDLPIDDDELHSLLGV